MTWDVFAGSISAPVDCVDPGDSNEDSCAGAVNCNVNFIVVPGVQSPQVCQADGAACYGNTNGRDR